VTDAVAQGHVDRAFLRFDAMDGGLAADVRQRADRVPPHIGPEGKRLHLAASSTKREGWILASWTLTVNMTGFVGYGYSNRAIKSTSFASAVLRTNLCISYCTDPVHSQFFFAGLKSMSRECSYR
jgi:hypothetical protein